LNRGYYILYYVKLRNFIFLFSDVGHQVIIRASIPEVDVYIILTYTTIVSNFVNCGFVAPYYKIPTYTYTYPHPLSK
jgi:hypothetical protein